jgi:hypothetical protein
MARAKKNPMSSAPLPVVAELPTEMEASFLRFIEGTGQRVELVDPLSDDGLRLQALYAQNFSQHPLDVLRRIMENPFSDPKDRMTAAKSIMEYSMRKPAAALDLSAKGSALSLDPSHLAALSAADLDALEKILAKTGTTA